MTPPTEQQFIETVREAFAFLRPFGFNEVSPPPHREKDPFQVWFKAGQRFVIVRGEGWGTLASVTLEHEDGLELAEIDLVPPEHRPRGTRARGPTDRGQLQQIRDAARRLAEHGAYFVAGDLGRFVAQARPLPPYKRPRG
jgi:hypothetical protein